MWRVASTPLMPGIVQVHHDDVRREARARHAERLRRRSLASPTIVRRPAPRAGCAGRAEEVVVVDEEHAERGLVDVLDRHGFVQRCLLGLGQAQVYWSVQRDRDRPPAQAIASAFDERERSITFPCMRHRCSGPRSPRRSRDRHPRSERDHRRVDRDDSGCGRQPGLCARAETGGAVDVIAEVEQHLGENRVRCVAMRPPTAWCAA